MAPALDATELLDKGKTFTSNIADVLHGLLDDVAAGAVVTLDRLRPLAEQAAAFFGDESDPVPAPPEGGVPVDERLGSRAEAARDVVGVTAV